MGPTEAGNLMGPERAHASDYQSHPEGITTSVMAVIPFSGRAVPTMVILTFMPLHLSQPSQPTMCHPMAAGGTTIDPHLGCAPPLGSIPIDTRNSTTQPREPHHYQPSGHGDTTEDPIADGTFTTVAAPPRVMVYSPPSNQVPEAYSHYHPSSSSPVNSGVVLPAPLTYQGEGYGLSASQQLGQIHQGTPPPSTTAGPIGVVGVDQYPSYSDYQLFRHDDTIREPIPNGTTTAVANSLGVIVHPPPFNPTPRATSWNSASGHQSSSSPVNSARVPLVPAYPNKRNGLPTSQQFRGQAHTPTSSTTVGPSRLMGVDQRPNYDYPSRYGDTTHKLITDSPHAAAAAPPGRTVCPPLHAVSGPPNHPLVNRGGIPPSSATSQNEGDGQSTSRQLSQTYQGTPTSSTTPGPTSDVREDQYSGRYKCTASQCDANYATKEGLNRHHKDHHGPGLVCDRCNSEFPGGRRYKLTEHRRTCPGPQLYDIIGNQVSQS